MKTIEEEIWDYIDGTGSEAEQAAIELKIKTDAFYAETYASFLSVHKQLGNIDLDEPSMAFTRNVMDKVALEVAPASLKTKTDKRIIYCISAFFIFSLGALLAYAVYNAKIELPKYDFRFSSKALFSSNFITGFLFADLVLGLVYLDYLLRRKSVDKTTDAHK